jgi:hypothetical protein
MAHRQVRGADPSWWRYVATRYPVRAVFAVHAKIDVEKGAGEMFAGGPLRNEFKGGTVTGELKLVAVGHFASLAHQGPQLWAEFVEMPFALFGVKRRTIARER